jgi:sugar lactone lactonase YvrE
MSADQPQVLVNCQCLLGESPVWDSHYQRIVWIDIFKGHIHQYSPELQDHQAIKIAKTPGCIDLSPDGEFFVAVNDGIARIDLATGQLEMLAELESDKADNRFNDGKFDPAGRFWAGTMSVSGKPCDGNLYAMDTDGSVSLKIAGVGCSNGMAWSRDHTMFYYIDTSSARITSYNYDVRTGDITNKTVILDIPAEDGLPDGMTIDSDGMLWVALWNGWKVIRVDPETGQILKSISLPVSRVTSCTFGGNNMQDLFITSARVGLSAEELEKQPLAGSLFVVKNSGYQG